MKKVLSFAMLLLFAGSFCLVAQDLDEILESHFETIGLEKTLEVESMIMKGKVVQMGMELPMVLYQKRPGMMRMEAEIQGMKLVQVFDGETGWSIMPWTGSMEPVDMGENEVKNAKQMADMEGDLYNWEEKGHKVTLVGEDDMEGTPVFKIKVEKKDGDIYTYYIDAENYVVLKTDAKVMVNGAEIEGSSTFSNFKPVNGMIIAHSIESSNPQGSSNIIIESIEFDTDMEKSLFEKPEAQTETQE